MRGIVVAVDENPRSLRGLEVGQGLAEQLLAPLSLYSVVPDEQVMVQRRRQLERGLVEAHVDVSPRIELEAANSAAAQLCRVVNEREGLLCMATQARSAVTAALLGSVASEVVRGARRPVVLAGPQLSRRWRTPLHTIIVPLDGSALAEAVLPHAATLARHCKAQLRLLRVVVPDLAREGPREHEEEAYLSELARRLQTPELNVSWAAVEEDAEPPEIIAEAVQEDTGHMLAMSTHGRSGLSRVVLGSVAYRVVQNARCPVMLLRPEEADSASPA